MPIHFTYNANHKERARRLQAEATPEEQAVWRLLRRKQVHGARFHRQRPIDQYIVDFYCPKAKLVIEIDGEHHFEPDHCEADRLRTEVLSLSGSRCSGFRIGRFEPSSGRWVARFIGSLEGASTRHDQNLI